MCEVFAHVRASKLLANKQVLWEELGVGLLLGEGKNPDGSPSRHQVYDWANAAKMESFLREQERWNCYLREYASVSAAPGSTGADNAAVVPKYDITLRGVLCGGISHVTNEWHFFNRSLPADLTLLTLQTNLAKEGGGFGGGGGGGSVQHVGQAPVSLKSWRQKRTRDASSSSQSAAGDDLDDNNNIRTFDVNTCLAGYSVRVPEAREETKKASSRSIVCPPDAPLATPVELQPGRTAEFNW